LKNGYLIPSQDKQFSTVGNDFFYGAGVRTQHFALAR
jgi:hypothetical protein